MAVALQDVVASIAGAFSIGFSKLYAVGDRVQIGDTRGDVIDIGLLRTTLMETGNWVSQDLYNGRIARIPNSTVLRGSVFNYSQGFRFVWDEINVLGLIQASYEMIDRPTALKIIGGHPQIIVRSELREESELSEVAFKFVQACRAPNSQTA